MSESDCFARRNSTVVPENQAGLQLLRCLLRWRVCAWVFTIVLDLRPSRLRSDQRRQLQLQLRRSNRQLKRPRSNSDLAPASVCFYCSKTHSGNGNADSSAADEEYTNAQAPSDAATPPVASLGETSNQSMSERPRLVPTLLKISAARSLPLARTRLCYKRRSVL